jgi:hypothetical protein
MEHIKKIHNAKYELDIWDIAGKQFIPNPPGHADIIFYCFDSFSFTSFTFIKNLIEATQRDSSTVHILLALKCESNLDIKFYKDITELIEVHGLFYAETSVYYNNDYIYKEFNKDDILKDKLTEEPIDNSMPSLILDGPADSSFVDSEDVSIYDTLRLGVKRGSSLYFSKIISGGFNEELEKIYYRGGVNIIIDYAVSVFESKCGKMNIKRTISLKKSHDNPIKVTALKSESICKCFN